MIYIALGANLPDGECSPAETLKKAVGFLGEHPNIFIGDTSRIWESPAYPNPSDPLFYNGVIQVDTALDPLEIMEILHHTEDVFGRVRTVQNAPRILDLDLLSCDEKIIEEGGFVLPHPRMHERSFVLFPLREIAPDFTHPVSGESIDMMIESLPEGQIIEVCHDILLS